MAGIQYIYGQFYNVLNYGRLFMASLTEISQMLQAFLKDRPVMNKSNKRDWRVYKLLRAEIDEAEVETDPEKIATELADILIFTMTIANNHGINMDEVVREKIARNILKYPHQNFQGKYSYDEAINKSRSEWREQGGEERFYE